MKIQLVAPVIIALALGPSAASAESCTLISLDTAASAPRSVIVTDEAIKADAGSGTVSGGGRLQVNVSGNRARYQYKYPQDRSYHSDTGFWCKNGETINF